MGTNLDISLHAAGVFSPTMCVQQMSQLSVTMCSQVRSIELDVRAVSETSLKFLVRHDEIRKRSSRRLLEEYLVDFFSELSSDSVRCCPSSYLNIKHIYLNLKDDQYAYDLCSYLVNFHIDNSKTFPRSFKYFVIETDTVIQLPENMHKYVRLGIRVNTRSIPRNVLENPAVYSVHCTEIKKVFGHPVMSRNVKKRVRLFIDEVNKYNKKAVIFIASSSTWSSEKSTKWAYLLPDSYVAETWIKLLEKVNAFIPCIKETNRVSISVDLTHYINYFMTCVTESNFLEYIKAGIPGFAEINKLGELVSRKCHVQRNPPVEKEVSAFYFDFDLSDIVPVSVPESEEDSDYCEKNDSMCYDIASRLREMDKRTDLLDSEITEAINAL